MTKQENPYYNSRKYPIEFQTVAAGGLIVHERGRHSVRSTNDALRNLGQAHDIKFEIQR